MEWSIRENVFGLNGFLRIGEGRTADYADGADGFGKKGL